MPRGLPQHGGSCLDRAATSEAIAAAAQALRDGALVAFPTETVYGLGADARNPAALRRLYATKGRPDEHPVIVHIAAADALSRWTRNAPAFAIVLANAFWPGPLTLILPRADGVSDLLTGGQDSIGLRVPAHPVAQALLARFVEIGGDGIAAPSANRFGRISATTAAHVADDFGSAVEVILDGGPCEHGIESTIVDCTRDQPSVLRPGAISVDQLAHVLGRAPDASSADAPRASGTLAAHYAPQTSSRLLHRDALQDALAKLGRPGRTHRGARPLHYAAAGLRRHMVRRAAGQRRVCASALREPACAGRPSSGRDLDRDAAGRSGLDRDQRSSAARHAPRLKKRLRQHLPANTRWRNGTIAATSSFCRFAM